MRVTLNSATMNEGAHTSPLILENAFYNNVILYNTGCFVICF